MNKIDLQRLAGYDEDFALWSTEQAALVRAGKFDRVDREHLWEEIEDLANRQRDEIESRMDVLLAHLLKWQFQPKARSNSWRATLVEQRNRIHRQLRRSPSLKGYPSEVMHGAYAMGLHEAIGETGLPESAFPETCPYSIEEILDPEFFPGDSGVGR